MNRRLVGAIAAATSLAFIVGVLFVTYEALIVEQRTSLSGAAEGFMTPVHIAARGADDALFQDARRKAIARVQPFGDIAKAAPFATPELDAALLEHGEALAQAPSISALEHLHISHLAKLSERVSSATTRHADIAALDARAAAADQSAVDLGVADRVSRAAVPKTLGETETFEVDITRASVEAVQAAIESEQDRRAKAQEAEHAAEAQQPSNSSGGGSAKPYSGGGSAEAIAARYGLGVEWVPGYDRDGGVGDGAIRLHPRLQGSGARLTYAVLHEIGHVRLTACDPGPWHQSMYSNKARELGYTGNDSSLYGAEAAADVWAYAHGAPRGFSPYPVAPAAVAELALACD